MSGKIEDNPDVSSEDDCGPRSLPVFQASVHGAFWFILSLSLTWEFLGYSRLYWGMLSACRDGPVILEIELGSVVWKTPKSLYSLSGPCFVLFTHIILDFSKSPRYYCFHCEGSERSRKPPKVAELLCI